MDFIRAISATRDDILEEVIDTELTNVKLEVTRFQEQLEELLIQDSKFNVLLFKEDFPLNCHPLSFIKHIKETYPNIRVIFIMTSTKQDDVDKYTTYLHSKQVYDIIKDNDFGRDQLISALFEPKSASDILQASKGISFETEFKNINTMEQMAAGGFDQQNENHINNVANININYNNNVKYSYPSPKVISFWSPKGGTGVDTLAIQTAYMLAKNTNVDVCLADLSDFPNMHLHFNLMDTRKNIESLYVQQATGKLNVYTVDNYIINGADTQFRLPNLHILPGAVKRINFYKKMESVDGNAFVGNCLESIIDTLREKYTIVILILSSNFYNLPTFAGLKVCNQINMVLENDASSFANANRYLHPEYGIFNACKIDKNKCKIILNKSYVEDTFYIDSFYKINGLPIDAKVPLLPDETYQAYKSASPDLLVSSSEVAKNGILSVVNTITYMEFENPTQAAPSKKGSSFGLFKGKKNK